ncbi:MAG: uracil-DNA glycosylase [Candidatus Sumerlaeia bacterium]
MNDLQKTFVLKHLALARGLGLEFWPGGAVAAEDVIRALEQAAAPPPPALTPAAGTPAPAIEPNRSRTDLTPEEKQSLLKQLAASIADCRRCRLCQGRTQVVFGTGNPNARLVFVGEAPGYHEDQQGEPFVGAAGQLLTKIIQAMQFTREEVYICNVIKCRPPENRDPFDDEIEQCEPFLLRQLEIIQPRVIVCLGLHAARTLLRNVPGISVIRGRWQTFRGIQLMPTYHPAYLLRTPEAKAKVWEDMQKVMLVFGKDPALTMARIRKKDS